MLLHAAAGGQRVKHVAAAMSTGETGRTRRQISVEASGSWP